MISVCSKSDPTPARPTKDPDGLEFEVMWIISAHLLTADDVAARASIGPLDLPTEISRFGRDELSGIGISTPRPSPPTPAKAT